MNLEKITNQLNQLNEKFKAVSSLNAVTPEEQWKKLAEMDKINKEIKKLRKKLI